MGAVALDETAGECNEVFGGAEVGGRLGEGVEAAGTGGDNSGREIVAEGPGCGLTAESEGDDRPGCWVRDGVGEGSVGGGGGGGGVRLLLTLGETDFSREFAADSVGAFLEFHNAEKSDCVGPCMSAPGTVERFSAED